MKTLLSLALILLTSIAATAKDAPANTLLWPSSEAPVIRFTFGRFVRVGSTLSQAEFKVDVTAENLWSKPIPGAMFDAYFFAKSNIRIGAGYIRLSNVGVNETVRLSLPFTTSGPQPTSFKVVATQLPQELDTAVTPKKIRMTVASIPAGADLAVDGQNVGATPKQVEFTVGKHALQLTLAGFHPGTFPLEVSLDDASGATVSYELGPLAHDTIEMRDGTTLIADVESMNASSVVARVAGNLQSLDRNQIKRILFAQRDALTGIAKQ
jgi:hypothetical protein